MLCNRFSNMIQLRRSELHLPVRTSPTLREVDLTVADGEWLLLAGPSGGASPRCCIC